MTEHSDAAVPTAAPSASFRIGGDLEVNRLGYGTMQIIGPGYWGPARDEAEAVRVLRRAAGLGVDLIDTADAYGAGPAQPAPAWLLHRAPNVLPIPGTSKVAHPEENVAASSVRLGRADIEALNRAVTA